MMTPSVINRIILLHHFQVVDTATATVDLKNYTSYVPLTSSLIATVGSSPPNITLEAMNTDASTVTSKAVDPNNSEKNISTKEEAFISQ